jgi:exosortase/archaeosortase family protein
VGNRKLNLKTEVIKGLKFLIGITAFYTFFWAVLSLADLYPLKSATAQAANCLLNLAGIPTQLVFGIEPTIVVRGVHAQITNLCAGDLEIALLLAIVLATWDRSLRKRLWGCLFGLALILVANPLRIFTVLAVGYYTNWQWADFTHSVLFRLMLIIIIVVYYFLWYVKYDRIKKFFKRL